MEIEETIADHSIKRESFNLFVQNVEALLVDRAVVIV